MHKSNYLLKNFNVINILLLVVIMILTFLVVPLFIRPVTFVPPVAEKPAQGTAESSSDESKTLLESDYVMIAEQNLFHPERKLIEGQLEEAGADEGPEFVLYGTLIADDMSVAYLEDLKSPVESPGRGKRQTALKQGDTLNGFTLEEIGTDQVVMVRGDERIVIPISDPDNPKSRIVAKEKKPVKTADKKQQAKSSRASAAKKVREEKRKARERTASVGTNWKKSTSSPEKKGYRPKIDYKNNRTPGGFLFDRLNR